MRNRKMWGGLALAIGVGCLVLTGFDVLAINFTTPALLPVVGLFLLMLGTFLLLFTGRRMEE